MWGHKKSLNSFVCRWVQSDLREEQTFDLGYGTGVKAPWESVRPGLGS